MALTTFFCGCVDKLNHILQLRTALGVNIRGQHGTKGATEDQGAEDGCCLGRFQEQEEKMVQGKDEVMKLSALRKTRR